MEDKYVLSNREVYEIIKESEDKIEILEYLEKTRDINKYSMKKFREMKKNKKLYIPSEKLVMLCNTNYEDILTEEEKNLIK